jgi:uncharacterized membrane protein YvbJ
VCCTKCGINIENELTKFCPKCGTSVEIDSKETPKETTTSTASTRPQRPAEWKSL